MKVHFRNKANKPVSIHPQGIKYSKFSEGKMRVWSLWQEKGSIALISLLDIFTAGIVHHALLEKETVIIKIDPAFGYRDENEWLRAP